MDILMAVRNGEKYLAEQIESILGQTEKGWKLTIQDDCSTDESAAIARRYAGKYPEKITVLCRGKPSGSAQANFFSLLSRAKADYCMTADQDDIWMPDKAERSLSRIREMERQYGKGCPLLVHSDAKVVDAGLNPVADSLCRMQRIDPGRTRLHQLVAQNVVTGCTVICNRALLGLLGEAPEDALMHDWWLALLASAFGQIGYLKTPTLLYRQHGENQVGAKRVGSWKYLAARLQNPSALRQTMEATSRQARGFLERYAGRLSEEQREMLAAFGSLPGQGKLKKWETLARYRTWKGGLLRKAGQIIYI